MSRKTPSMEIDPGEKTRVHVRTRLEKLRARAEAGHGSLGEVSTPPKAKRKGTPMSGPGRSSERKTEE